MTTAVLLAILAAELTGAAVGYAFLREALDLVASLAKAWRTPGAMDAAFFGSPFVLLLAALLAAIFLALALGATAAAATLGRWLLLWRGLDVGRRDVVYLALLLVSVNVGLFLGLTWLEPAATLPPLLREREVALALAGFLGLVALTAALIAGSILRPRPTPSPPPAPPPPLAPAPPVT